MGAMWTVERAAFLVQREELPVGAPLLPRIYHLQGCQWEDQGGDSSLRGEPQCVGPITNCGWMRLKEFLLKSCRAFSGVVGLRNECAANHKRAEQHSRPQSETELTLAP